MKLSNYIEITGIIFSEQGNKKGRNNWMKNLHEATKTSQFPTLFLPNAETTKVHVHFTSEDTEVNELLSRVVGDVEVSQIKFPWDDVPEQPKCNGNFNRRKGEIEHPSDNGSRASCPIHAVLIHKHVEDEYGFVSQEKN